MSASVASSSDRRIALIRPAANGKGRENPGLQLFESMLWAFKGTLSSNWVTVDSPDSADVVVVAGSKAGDAVAQWKGTGKPVIALADSPEDAPAGEFVLVYPFQATRVLHLLNALDARLQGPSRDTAQPAGKASTASASSASIEEWSFVRAIETLREVRNEAVWIEGSLGATPILWMKGDATEYFATPDTVRNIRQGKVQLDAIRLKQGSPPPPGRRGRPISELCWFAGYYASHTLAPWLKPTAIYRIPRWPDFGLIRPLPSQIRATALLSAAPLTVGELARRAQMEVPEVFRTLNALEACELLTVVLHTRPTPRPPRERTPQPPGGITSLLRLVRKRLGLAAHP